MTDVGVRELKAELSAYLERAAAGETIRVTKRGKPFVELLAVVELDPESENERRFREQVAAGELIPAERPGPLPPVEPIPPDADGRTIEDILREEREADYRDGR